MRVFSGGADNEPPRLFHFLSKPVIHHVSPKEIIMRKTTQPSVTIAADDAHAILDAIVRLEHRTEYERLGAGHYRIITRLCQTLEAPQFYTEYFARKAVTTKGE